MECPVNEFFLRVKEAGEEIKRKDLVLLAGVRLLEEKERKSFFSLLLQEIHISRMDRPEQLLSLGVVSVLNEYYVLDDRVRKVLLEMHTKRVREAVLVQSNEPVIPQPNERYTEILFKIISNRQSGTGAIKRLMSAQGLIEKGEITHRGFNFLLESKKNQMWTLILAYLERSDREKEIVTLSEILSKNPKRLYYLDKIENKTELLELFRSLGLLSVGAGGRVEFSSEFALLFGEDSGEKARFLILESNFRMYVYGENQLNIFIISLFAVTTRIFPGMIVTFINEDSARKAFDLGITATQIENYLINNSIYEIDKNVLDQLHLWESKRNRIASWPSYLFSNFLNYKDFLLTETFCRDQEIEHKSYKDKRILVISVEGYERVKEFIKSKIK